MTGVPTVRGENSCEYSMSYQQNIRRSSLRFSLRKVAVRLVTSWLECAKINYDIGGVGDFDCDESEAENDFVEHLSRAIESLVNNKSREKKSIPGWSFGFICGHTQGALNVKWSNQYLIEPSKEFEGLMKIKTIIEIFKIDNDIPRKIEIVYNYLTNHKNQVANEEGGLPNNVISLIQRRKIQNTSREKYKNEFDGYFRSLLMTNYLSLLQDYDFMCCPDLTEYLNEREVMDIVGREHFA